MLLEDFSENTMATLNITTAAKVKYVCKDNRKHLTR